MPLTARDQENQITFKQELARKATHMGALVIPAGYELLGLSKSTALGILIPVAFAMILIDMTRLGDLRFWRAIVQPIIGPMIRHHEERGDWTGATYILVTSCLTVRLFDKPIAVAALAFIIVGDSFAALIGRKYGKHKFGRKSFEGSFGCLAGTLIVAAVGPAFGLPLWIGVVGAVVATVTEALSTRIDDNVSVPLLSGLCMAILTKI